MSDPSNLPADVRHKLLLARTAHIAGAYDEAHHWLYSIACPGFDCYDPWAALEGRQCSCGPHRMESANVPTVAELEAIVAPGATDQPNGATGWIDNAVTPPGESVERVLVAYPTGLVETTQAHYVRLYPTNYPWWMPLPVAPDPTPQPQPDAVASTFADCETAMGMEYTTPPCTCAEYYPGLPHHPDCPTRNADPTDGAAI